MAASRRPRPSRREPLLRRPALRARRKLRRPRAERATPPLNPPPVGPGPAPPLARRAGRFPRPDSLTGCPAGFRKSEPLADPAAAQAERGARGGRAEARSPALVAGARPPELEPGRGPEWHEARDRERL